MGCAGFARNPFRADEVFGADLSDNVPRNLSTSHYFKVCPRVEIPVEDGFFNSISAFDFIEHLNRSDGYPNSFIVFLNEASRVLSTGGIFLGVTPAFPSPLSFQDPTHINFITEGTVQYFIKNDSTENLEYGIDCDFELIQQFWTGPFSSIRKDSWESHGLSLSSLRLISNPRKIRRIISDLRNPTHLVWVLRKV